MRIHQFHSGIAVGDAISNEMFHIQTILRNRGYDSEIYVEYVPDALRDKVRNIKSYESNEDNILIIHHSMGMNVFDFVTKLGDKKILIYHNITPEKYFDDEYICKYIRMGLKQTENYKDYVDYVIADSNYNRQDLLRLGYSCDIDVMPVQISLDRFDTVDADVNIVEANSNTTNVLFVGRVVRNKCQLDLVKTFAMYHNYFNKGSKLFIVGDSDNSSYVQQLLAEAKNSGVEDSVVITGKVSETQLKAYYQVADIFLCMSEHEGFGVPLLEAMKMQVPVVAYRSSAVPETMHGAGILFTEKSYAHIAALMDEVVVNADFRNKIIERQNKRIVELKETDTETILFKAIDSVSKQTKRMRTTQIQGPFESSYSLAVVNRQLGESLDALGGSDVSIYCTEGPGDYVPNVKDLTDKPVAKKLWLKSKDVTYPDITIRNMYPPRVNDVNGGLNFQAFYWEESVIPKEYIDNFNKFLSGIGTPSNYVKEKLLENGLKIPVETIGNGVKLCDNYDKLKPYSLKTKKAVKFLHISSAFPRKGVDLLLKGYYKAFTGDDDVCLVLKTFPNIHNKVQDIINQLNQEYSNPPEVEWINRDLPAEELYSLYKVADCYVSVARGEGFGLPVAEAMLAKVPVIVSPNSGMADFCNEKTALLVKYTLVPAHTHLTVQNDNNISTWAEPDVEGLITQLQYFVVNKDADVIRDKVQAAYDLISTQFNWQVVAERWQKFIDRVEHQQYRPKVAMVTTWNSKCGIAEYTKMCVEASNVNIDYTIFPNYGVELICEDEDYVEKRLWHKLSVVQENIDVLLDRLKQSDVDIVHFQFHHVFFDLLKFAKAILELAPTKKVVVTFHKTEDTDIFGKIACLSNISKELNLCSALIVHQQKDKDLLISYGIKSKIIKLIPLGQILYPDISSQVRKKQLGITSSVVIGSYGFFLPHKGIKEMILAMPKVLEKYPDALYMPVCALYEDATSKEYLKECVSLVEKLNIEDHVKFVTDFLPNDVSMKYLQACDVMVMAYKPTQESASGAIRFCLAAYRPTIVTKQPMFEEFKDFTHQIECCDSDLLANEIEKMLQGDMREDIQKAKAYVRKSSWYNTGKEMYKLYCSVMGRTL